MMKRISLMIAMVIPFSLYAKEQAIFQDRVELGAAGSRVVVRSALWPDAERGMVNIEQRFQVNADGNLRYDYDEQDERTKAYHRSYCAESGLDPFVDGEVTFTPEAAGWHCSKDELYEEGEELSDVQRSVAGQDRSVDFVTARAPSGSTQVGVNFPAIGYITYQSSQAGSMQGSVHVDFRCRTYVSKHYSNPFSGNHEARVSCLAHDSRFLTTGMEGCVPRICGNDRGTISVRQ
jgi:hypothetical protein